MKTQAWAWLTAGVLALGLNGIYQDGGAQWAHQMVHEAAFQGATLLSPISGRVDQLLAKLQMTVAREETQSCRLGTAVARIQEAASRSHSRIARMEAMSARREAQCARLEANRARIEAQVAGAQFATMTLRPMEFNVPQIHVTCPRVRVALPPLPLMRPVHIEMPGNGPV